MTANLSGAQFDNVARAAAYKRAKGVPGREAPVFYATPHHTYKPNPFAAHLPPPEVIDHGDGSMTSRATHGIPGYSRTARVEGPRRVEQVPLDRLESTQGYVSANHARNMGRRKGTAPPVEVTHHVDADRYVLSEGNHRATVALLRGDTHVPALVTRIRQT